MVIVKFEGRLGNQIFQYAFAYSLSQKLSTFFLIERETACDAFFKYFKTNSISRFYKLNLYLVQLFIKHLPRKTQKGNDKVDLFIKSLEGNYFYNGFFQSEKYFVNIENVKTHLLIKKKYTSLFEEKFGELFSENKIIAIHCRLGDYIEWGSEELGGSNLTLPESYYRNCLKEIRNLEKYKILIVTDDKVNIKNKFNFLSDKMILSQEEIIDFQILKNADIVITSNSSFSWWAAYLNSRAQMVYAPEYWLGFKVKKEYPNSVIPESWIKINCFDD